MRGGVKIDWHEKDVKNDCTKDVKPCFTVARIEEQPREGDEGARALGHPLGLPYKFL